MCGSVFEDFEGTGQTNSGEIGETLERRVLGGKHRMKLGPLRHFHRDKAWKDACKLSQDFADRVYHSGLRSRKNLPRTKSLEPLCLLHRFVLAHKDQVQIHDQIIQTLAVAAPPTVIALLSNAIFELVRLLDAWQRVRDDVKSSDCQDLMNRQILKALIIYGRFSKKR